MLIAGGCLVLRPSDTNFSGAAKGNVFVHMTVSRNKTRGCVRRASNSDFLEAFLPRELNKLLHILPTLMGFIY